MAEAEHRLAAILAADVVGYSRLMAGDDRATVTALDEARAVFRKAIGSAGGRVVDTAGDSVLAVFTTATGAVRAAIAAQTEINETAAEMPEDRRMLFRIGVTLGEVIEKDDGTVYGDGVNIAARLEAASEPGGITISGTAHDHVQNRIEVGFHDLGTLEVKNIPNPVRAYRLALDGEVARGRRAFSTPVLAAATATVLIIVGVVVWGHLDHSRPTAPAPQAAVAPDDPALALPTGPSIAVLPFVNMSGDAGQDYFSDGLSEEILIALSRYSSFHVVARNSSFRFRGEAVDGRTAGAELGADYVLEGSVRKLGQTLRVTARLLGTDDGAQMWAETFERELTAGNLFEIQDEITRAVTSAIADSYGIIAQAQIEAAARKPPESLELYDCVYRGFAFYRGNYTPAEHLAVRDCFDRAVVADPNSSDGWAWLAFMSLAEHTAGFNPRTDSPVLERMLDNAQKAVNLDPNSQRARLALALSHFYRADIDAFLVEAERTLALNPNHATTLGVIGQNMAYAGKWERGLALVEKAMALNPAYPSWLNGSIAWGHYRERDYQAALAWALKVDATGAWQPIALRAAIYGQMGDTARARDAVSELLDIAPDVTAQVRHYHQKINMSDDLIAHIIDGLRKAGLDIPDENRADG